MSKETENSPAFSYLDLLNEQQRAAVTYKDGPSLVIAGAGSGKTRVLTYKIVDLLNNGYNPGRILALTFTNKAAREMKSRIEQMVGPQIASRLWMGTFHSIFLRILRRHPEETGYKSNFTIYDTSDSRSLLKTIIKELGLDEKSYKPQLIGSIISNAKNSLISAEQYLRDKDNYEADRRAKRPLTGRIYQLYEQRCRLADAMDFDDILVNMNILLRDYPSVCDHYRQFFQYILVDEYQDTNFAQNLIVSQLAAAHKRLCVVGDDAQSIYSFRGANIGNILGLEKHYPELKIFKLERNYRSTQNIINAAGSLIEKNTRQMRKNVYSENEPGDKVRVVYTYSDIAEAGQVVKIISELRSRFQDTLDEFAILYRTNAQSRTLEEALRQRNIPYRIYGGLSFYQRKEIKDAICYFRLAVNPDDDEALRRVINYPARGIGETTMRKIQSAAIAGGVSMWRVLMNPGSYNLQVNSGTMRKLESFRQIISEFIADNEKGASAFELGQLIYNRTGILSSIAHDNTPENISRQENLAELLGALKDFSTSREESGEGDIHMQDFLSVVSLATDQDSEEEADKPKVTLMTAHAAKGLEFNHVFVVGVEEELFPSLMSMDSAMQVEEERRLLYVAITRARKTCTLTYAGSRYRNGQTVAPRPSRFLQDMDPKFLKIESGNVNRMQGGFDPVANYRGSERAGSGWLNRKSSYAGSRSGDSVAPASFSKSINTPSPGTSSGRLRRLGDGSTSSPAPIPASAPGEHGYHSTDELKSGMRILHQRFGEGRILEVTKISGEDGILVAFDQVGEKRMILKFAKFIIL